VWNRETLALHCTLRGHEGPVNAIGLQGSRVVSASGDGQMILWDIDSGKKLSTFEGHDRGLACIEFKVSTLCHCQFCITLTKFHAGRFDRFGLE
jgi:F-box and WD-40 domain protein 1/11